MPGEVETSAEYLMGYRAISALFKAATFVFYHTVSTSGLENIPAHPAPVIMCFNHTNGLTDSAIVIRTSPRMVRFCAKDTLWKVPFISLLIKTSGALPIQRRDDHSNPDNTETLSAVKKALIGGSCVGFAPEGTSRMRPFMTPIKTGVARISTDSILESNDPNLSINIIPCGLTFLHREKWRSNVLAQYGEPIVVNKKFIDSFPSVEHAVREITTRVQDSLDKEALTANSWATLRLAIVLTRIYKPLGTRLSLKEFIDVLKHFARVLGSKESETSPYKHQELRTELRAYQEMLNAAKIRDLRILQCTEHGRPGAAIVVWRILLRVLLCLVLCILAVPGIVLWAPVFFVTKREEWRIISKGIVKDEQGNVIRRKYAFDTIAETKMVLSFMLLAAMFFIIWVGAGFFIGFLNAVGLSAAILGLMWVTVRWLEDAIASARALRSLFHLLIIPQADLEPIIKARNALKEKILRLAKDSNAPNPQGEENMGGFASYFSLSRRRKKDWTEVLRLHDDLSYLGQPQDDDDALSL